MLEQQLKDVLQNPYADISAAQAARKAVELRLDAQDREYQRSQEKLTQGYLDHLTRPKSQKG